MGSDDRIVPDPASAGVSVWKRWRVLLLCVIAVVVAGVVAIGIAWLSDPRAENGAALAAGLGLPKGHACGTGTVTFSPWPGADEIEVFALERTWHWVGQCLRPILDRAGQKKSRAAAIDDFLFAQVLYVLSRPPVRFYRSGDDARHSLEDVLGDDGRLDQSRFDRVAYTNEHEVAHNAMSQGALGGWLLAAARSYARRGERPELAATYEALGNATLGVILDDVGDGGLRSRSACSLKPGSHCSWFHAVTDQSRPSPRAGGTLNKHLIVILDLRDAAQDLRGIERLSPKAGRSELAELYAAAAVEGMYQLAYGEGHRGTGSAPNLFDYIARDASGAPIQDSWLFYGLNPEKTKGGYYLEVRAYKNCHYHIFDMGLLRRIFRTVGKGADLSGFTRSDPTLGRSLIGFIAEAFDRKLAIGMFEDTPTADGGEFGACRPELFDGERSEVIRAYFREMSATAS